MSNRSVPAMFVLLGFGVLVGAAQKPEILSALWEAPAAAIGRLMLRGRGSSAPSMPVMPHLLFLISPLIKNIANKVRNTYRSAHGRL